MSAFICDPRTIDYLVQWAQRHGGDVPRCYIEPDQRESVPNVLAEAVSWERDFAGNLMGVLRLNTVHPNALGTALMAQNVRSVQYRYPNDAPDDLPGPGDQRRVWAYRFVPIARDLDPAWVVKAADCWRYQSCEEPEHEETLAWQIAEQIRESAVHALTQAAPWEITAETLGEGVPQ